MDRSLATTDLNFHILPYFRSIFIIVNHMLTTLMFFMDSVFFQFVRKLHFTTKTLRELFEVMF
jgi:hypothetical protein